MADYENEAELRERARIERQEIVAKYDRGRDEGVKIEDWEDPKLEIYHKKDRYGFFHDKRLPDASKRSEREKELIAVERTRALKWAQMFKEEKKYFGPNAKNREKMINRVHKGIPLSVRGRVWALLLDIDKLKQEQTGVYVKMRDLARKISPDIRQIDLDVNRTYRDNEMFRERYNVRQRALFHVLAAYSMYNTEVGYCQGMSQIAALLLMYLNEEEDAFWALGQLMVQQKYAMHGFFIQGFPKLMRFQAHHDKVFKKFLPRLKKHFDKQGVDSGIYTLKWFFQCFLDRLPFSLTLRVWDLYLLEGERVLIAMAYNILKMHRRYLIKLQMDEIIEHLQVNLARDFGFDDDAVIDKLRESMYDLRSNGLDYPGRPPPDELPQKPFGLVPTLPSEVKHLTIERELGLRSGLTDSERKYSEYNLAKQKEAERAIEEEEDEEDVSNQLTSTAAADEDGSDINGETTSLPGDSITEPTNDEDDDDDDDDDDVVLAHDRSFNALSNDRARNVHLNDSRSPLPLSEAQHRLDESLQFMLQSASDLNNGRPDSLDGSLSQQMRNMTTNSSRTSSRCVSQLNNMLDSSFESNPGDVVRIRVPYRKSYDASPTSPAPLPDLPRYEGNKILITVNHSPTSPTYDNKTPTNSPPHRHSTYLVGPPHGQAEGPRAASAEVPKTSKSSSSSTFYRQSSSGNVMSAAPATSSSSTVMPDTPLSAAAVVGRREVRSYHQESYSNYTSSRTMTSSSSSTMYTDRAQPSATNNNNNSHKHKQSRV